MTLNLFFVTEYARILQTVQLEDISTVTCLVTPSAPYVPRALFRLVVPTFAPHVPGATQLLDLGPPLRMIATLHPLNVEVSKTEKTILFE